MISFRCLMKTRSPSRKTIRSLISKPTPKPSLRPKPKPAQINKTTDISFYRLDDILCQAGILYNSKAKNSIK